MTRLSDHLRGLADRAPVGDAVVSVEVASKRIHRQRRLRAGANAAAGVGAATVVAFAAINPGASPKDVAADAPMMEDAGGAYAQDNSMASAPADGSRLAWGTCGSYPLSDREGDTQSDQLTLDDVPGELSGGDTLTLDTTLVPMSSRDVETFGPQALILWDGMVVASGPADTAEAATLSLAAGEPIEQSVSADLVDCWEGEPLPGGTYQVLVAQEWYSTADVAPPLPTDPSVDPDAGPGLPVEPAVEPTIEPAPGSEADSGSGAATGSASTATETAPQPAVDDPGTGMIDGLPSDAVTFARVVSSPVDVVLSGDVPDDPFGQYLPKPPTPIETPDDTLTPDQARDQFASHLTSTPWAMEPGTQRVIKTNDSQDVNNESAWAQNYFGCSWDDSVSGGFPATSAEWDLLDVSASLPSSIDVSYGWVVEGNPVVDFTVTNVSGQTLPGYWGSEPNTGLVLVRDGKVVAEGYPVSAQRDQRITAQQQDGFLSPDEVLDGSYLWREVNGCYTGDSQVQVGPGTYTVLNVQPISFNSGDIYYETYVDEGGSATGGGAAREGDAGVSVDPARTAIAPAPGPEDFDWLELQVWTSLGTVTVR